MRSNTEKNNYILDAETNVWSRPGYRGIAYSDGDEAELRIAAIIKGASDLSVLSSELRKHCTDWVSLYHLTSARANILRPFEADLHGEILEIGSGCGAITRYLGECGGNVLALEGSPRRAAIARSRTRDLPNVTVVSDKFDLFQSDQKFDVITLIGVFEYANLFSIGENPALSMLERVHSLLKADGKLIIAIENQFGLKYFAGAPEDHLGKAMYGIECRYREDQPQTYGRAVLQEMLKNSGFVSAQFMAPFPDYKLPISIVTEAGFNDDDFDASAFAWQSVRRDPQMPEILNFSPELVWPALVKNKIALDLSNSFLILSFKQKKDNEPAPVFAWHFSTERVKQYCKQTSFARSNNGEIEVRYRSLLPDQQMPIIGRQLRFSIPEKSEYIHGKLLSHEFIEVVSRDGWSIEEIGSFFKRYILIMESVAGSIIGCVGPITADTLLPGECFDCLPQNLVWDSSGSWRVIDEEWSLLEPISAARLLFRASLSLVNLISRFGNCANREVTSLSEFFQVCFDSVGFEITSEQLVALARQELEIHAEVSQRAIDGIDVNTWMNAQSLPRHTLNQVLFERELHIVSLNQSIVERDEHIARILTSNSWRLTKPFRVFRQSLSTTFQRFFKP